MKQKNNQKGMTLVIVLLMITVFSILGMSVIGYTITNTKQVETSEQDMQAVDLAEMGVVYYKNAFISKARDIMTLKIEEAIDALEDYNKNHEDKILITEETILDKLDPLISGKENEFFIPNLPENLVQISESDNDKFSFQIDSPYVLPYLSNGENNRKVTLNFISAGSVNSVTESIDTTFILDIVKLIQSIKENSQGGDSDDDNDETEDGGNGTLVDLDTIITKPVVLNTCGDQWKYQDCSYPSSITINTVDHPINNITSIVDGDFSISNFNNPMNNTFIYITDNATIHNLTGGQGIKLYIGKTANFYNINGKIHGNNERSLIVVKETVTFHNQTEFDTADIYANKATFSHLILTDTTITTNESAIFNGNFEIKSKSSTINIGGNTNFNNVNFNGDFDKNSKSLTINIGGNADFNNVNFNGNFDTNSKICVAGKIDINNLSKDKYPNRIYSPEIDINKYNANCPPIGDNNDGDNGDSVSFNVTPAIIENEINKQLEDNIKIIYK